MDIHGTSFPRIKRTDAPRITPSMRSALEVLRLERLYVVHAGATAWPLDKRIAVVPLAGLFEHLRGERERAQAPTEQPQMLAPSRRD